MAGFFDSQPSTTSVGGSTVASTGLPDWVQQYDQGILQTGLDYANTPFQPYTGPRVAGMSSGQTAAQTGAQGLVNSGTGMLPQAQADIQGGLNAVGQPLPQWNSTTANQYLSPYTSSVVNEIGRLGNQNFNENLMPQVQDAFIGAGGSGSTRNADILGRTARDNEANTLGAQQTALNSGYTNAQTAFNADANRDLSQQTAQGQLGVSAGSTLGSLGATTGLNGLSLLNSIGTQDQTTQQKALDTAYGDFTDQRDFDINNAGKLHQLISGLPLPANPTQNTTNSTTETGAGSSQAQGLSALLTTLYGIFGTKAPNNAPISQAGSST